MIKKQREILQAIGQEKPISTEAEILRKRLVDDVLPEIKEASVLALDVYNIDQFGTNYRLGTFLWDRLCTSLPILLADKDHWDISTPNNILTLTTRVFEIPFTFYLPRVAEASRVPTAARSVKEVAQGARPPLFLSEELEGLCLASSPFLIGYDTTAGAGLRSVTINQLVYLGGKEYFSETLAEIYNVKSEFAGSMPATERVASPVIASLRSANKRVIDEGKAIATNE